jgi:hypothetical protein
LALDATVGDPRRCLETRGLWQCEFRQGDRTVLKRETDLLASCPLLREPIQVVGPARELMISNGPRATYRLKWDEKVTKIELGDDQTVGDAKLMYASKVNVRAEHVTILCGGKVMRDAHVLSERRIPAGSEIIVYVNTLRFISLIILSNVRPIGTGQSNQ